MTTTTIAASPLVHHYGRYIEATRKLVNNLSALRKYFEHTGGHLTADGTDDCLIKLEGVPPGETFGWSDDDVEAEPEAEGVAAVEPEPEDVVPRCADPESDEEDGPRAPRIALDDNIIDDEDPDSDEEDGPPAPRIAPVGFRIAPSSVVPSAAMLEPKAPEQQQLVGRVILFNRADVGWCVGVVRSANGDR